MTLKNNKRKIQIFFCISIFLTQCVSKTDLSFIPEPTNLFRPISYVPILPAAQNGFSELSDITVGFDELIYVVDKGRQEVIVFNTAMMELSRKFVQGATKVVQDRRLNLLVLGTSDTTISNISYKDLATVYRFELKNSNYGLANATLKKKVVHPFYFPSNSVINRNVKFNDLCIVGDNELGDNLYYLARTGTNNNPLNPGGPDDAILLFDKNDNFQYFVQISGNEGIKTDFFKSPKALVASIQPPQSDRMPRSMGFYYANIAAFEPENRRRVLPIEYIPSPEGATYIQSTNLILDDTTKADGFLLTLNKFSSVSDLAASGDGTNLLFVADNIKDSIFVFGVASGLEGITPPAGSSNRKNIKVSFGGTGKEFTQFDNPVAITYFDRILYVADAGNNRILRFKLTSDFR